MQHESPTQPVTMARRGFLSGAAGIAAGGTVLALAIKPAAPAAQDDSALLRLEEQIFQAHEAETANDDEIKRLFSIWDPEYIRLYGDLDAGRSTMTREEITAHLEKMPEVQEHTRLCLLKHSNFCTRYHLEQQMRATPARTPEGRRAKLLVLLNFMVADKWMVHDEDAEGDIPEVRSLLIEFVGGVRGIPAQSIRRTGGGIMITHSADFTEKGGLSRAGCPASTWKAIFSISPKWRGWPRRRSTRQ